MKRFIIALAAACAYAVAAPAIAAPASGATVETAESVAGVQAVEKHWNDSFMGGDTAYLDGLLIDSYVSVSANGTPRPKAAIVALARAYAQTNPKRTAMPKPDNHIELHGPTAIVTSLGSYRKGGRLIHDRSSDVFFYSSGRWHALYSQHTDF